MDEDEWEPTCETDESGEGLGCLSGRRVFWGILPPETEGFSWVLLISASILFAFSMDIPQKSGTR